MSRLDAKEWAMVMKLSCESAMALLLFIDMGKLRSIFGRMRCSQSFSNVIIGLLAVFFTLCALSPAFADERRQVLYLNSYQNGYAWSDNILAGIRETFAESGYIVDLQVEYMDAKKHPAAENRQILKRLFANKFADSRFDAIICSDNDAFQFLLEYRDELFPGVPVAFCGVNDLKPGELDRRPGFTGVVERLDIRGNLEQALLLSPEKRRIVVVGDESLSSEAIAAQIKAVVPDFEGRLAFSFWENQPLDKLLVRVSELPRDTLLFYIPVYAEAGGKYLSAGEVVEALYQNANVPIYGAWSFLLGHGIVGGRLLDGANQGRAAASMVLRIFDGTPISDMPVREGEASPPTFDWRVLDKFGLTGAAFPEDARFINRPEPTYRLEKRVVWTVGILLLALTIFTLMLGASRNRAIRAEKELAVSRKTLRSIIDTLPQLIYWKDDRSRYRGVNRRFADFFGLKDVLTAEGKSNREILVGESFAETGELMDQEVLQTDEPILRKVVEYDGDDHDGTVFEISKIPLHDDTGTITGVLSTAEDISARVELERQLIQSQKMEAVGTFVGGITHDFNNLLTTIINSAELALLEVEGTDAAEDVMRAKLAAEQGSQLVSRILTYARPSRQEAVHIDAGRTIAEALGLVDAMVPENIRFLKEMPDQAIMGVADPSQLQQVVMNLCTNAIHALRRSGGTLSVSLALQEDGEGAEHHGSSMGRCLQLIVVDDGPGIPDEVQGRVFDPFYSTKDRHEGTGLGLAIVQGIVQAHDGRIRLVSKPGQTLFDIVIPFPEGDESADMENEFALEGTERILFVEDDPGQLSLIPRSLEQFGYEVTAAHGGQAALDTVMSGSRFDAVVTDYDMPGLTGVELARTMRQLFPEVPVILVSGGQDAAVAAQGETGVAKIVLKPYTGASLAEALREVLDGKTISA